MHGLYVTLAVVILIVVLAAMAGAHRLGNSTREGVCAWIAVGGLVVEVIVLWEASTTPGHATLGVVAVWAGIIAAILVVWYLLLLVVGNLLDHHHHDN